MLLVSVNLTEGVQLWGPSGSVDLWGGLGDHWRAEERLLEGLSANSRERNISNWMRKYRVDRKGDNVDSSPSHQRDELVGCSALVQTVLWRSVADT